MSKKQSPLWVGIAVSITALIMATAHFICYGFQISLDGTVEYNILPESAPLLTHEAAIWKIS